MNDTNSNWYKLDNVAKVFLASYTKRNPRSIRVSSILTDPIDATLLQEALDLTIKLRPQFQVRIRRGFFWNYLEQTATKPVVSAETSGPCPLLYGERYKGVLHYQVTYYRNRINIDMSHAISDGTGALSLLKLLTLNYLKLKYPGKFDESSIPDDACADDRSRNSYDQFYDNKGFTIIPKTILNKKPRAFQIQSRRLPYNQLQYIEVHTNADVLLKRSKELNVSLTSYLGAELMFAIHADMPLRQSKHPITISIPVNLRNYYPSDTLRNFFNNIDISHKFDGSESIETLASEFEEKLRANLEPEVIKKQMNRYQNIEQLFLARMVPLFFKQPIVKMFSKKESRTVTAILSNLGKIDMPEETTEYIKGFTDFCSTDNLFITITTYKNDMVLGIASSYSGTGMIRRMLSSFEKSGCDITLYATEIIH
ncbi:MAG: hypothetical protein K6E98_00710 [Lachnospiraceae bacterium]|nr:hypothetical protein [Lachnospiraceae bacterium]